MKQHLKQPISREHLLGKEKVSKALLTVSVPAVIGMLINGIYNLVDTIFIGQTVGSMGIAGLAIYIPIMSLIMAVCGLIGMGASSYFSRSFGKKDYEEVNLTTGNTITLSFVFGTLFGCFGYFFAEPILRLFGATPSILPYALPYTKVMFIGTIYFPFVVALNNILRAEGNAKDAMIAMMVGTVSNIALDWVFVIYLDMGLEGAAIATNLGKGLSVLFMVWYLFLSKHTIVKLKWKYLLLKKRIVQQIFAVGSSSFAMNVAGTITIALTNFFLGKLGGDIAIASWGLIFRISMFEMMAVIGFVQGLQPMVGYNFGANQFRRVFQSVHQTIKWTFFLGLVVMAISEIFPVAVIKVFTSEIELINATVTPLRISMIFIPLVSIEISYTVFFQSIGQAKIAFILSVLRQVLLFIPLLVLFSTVFNFGVIGIWICFPITDAVSTYIAYLIYKSFTRKNFPTSVTCST